MRVKESKRDRFVRIAETRTNVAVDAIAQLGRCSNRAVYEYSDSDIEKITTALHAAVYAVEAELKGANRFRLTEPAPSVSLNP